MSELAVRAGVSHASSADATFVWDGISRRGLRASPELAPVLRLGRAGISIAAEGSTPLSTAGLVAPSRVAEVGFATLAGGVTTRGFVGREAAALAQLLERTRLTQPPVFELRRSYDAPQLPPGARRRFATDLGDIFTADGVVVLRTGGHAVSSSLRDRWVIEVTGPHSDRLPFQAAMWKLLRDAVATTLELRGTGVALHATAVQSEGGATVFVADSGVGKTAHALATGLPIIADETVLIAQSARTFLVGPAVPIRRGATEFVAHPVVGPVELERLVLLERRTDPHASVARPSMTDVWMRLMRLRAGHPRVLPGILEAISVEDHACQQLLELASAERAIVGRSAHGQLESSAALFISTEKRGGEPDE